MARTNTNSGGGSSGVTSLNTLTGVLSLISGTGISIGSVGSSITITNTGAGAGLAIGATVTGGNPSNILFVDGINNLGQDNNFFYDSGSLHFHVGFPGNSFIDIDAISQNYYFGDLSQASTLHIDANTGTITINSYGIAQFQASDNTGLVQIGDVGGHWSFDLMKIDSNLRLITLQDSGAVYLSIDNIGRIYGLGDLSGAGNGTFINVNDSLQQITFNNKYIFPFGDGSLGQTLVTDGSGNITWQNSGTGVSSLTATEVAFGDGSNLMTSSSGFTYVNGTLTILGSGFDGTLNFGNAGLLRNDGFGNVVLDNTGHGQEIAMTSRGSVNIQDSTGSGNGITVSGGNTFVNRILSVGGFYTLPNATGTSGQAIVNNGSGGSTWVTLTTGTVTSIDVSGGSTGLTTSGGPVTGSGTITLGGDLIVANGGTGVTSLTAYAVICGGTTSTNPVQSIASVGTTGQILTSNGSGQLPTFQTPSTNIMVASKLQTTNATLASALNYPVPGVGNTTFRVGFTLSVQTIAATTLQLVVTYTDELSILRTVNVFPGITSVAVGSVGAYQYFPIDIVAKGGTAINVAANVTGLTIVYDIGANIIKLF